MATARSDMPRATWLSLLIRWRACFILACLIAFAAVLRFHHLAAANFWLDETGAVVDACGELSNLNAMPIGVVIERPPRVTQPRGPWYAVWTSLDDESHPPLYLMLLRLWGGAFGWGDFSLRALSAVCSVAAVAFVFGIANRLYGLRAAMWAALCLAMANSQIEYAQETRMYALLTATAMASAYSLVLLTRADSRRRLPVFLLIVSFLSMLLTHYFALAPAVAITLYAIFGLRGAARWRALLAMGAAALTYAVIWGPFLYRQRHSIASTNAWSIAPSPQYTGLRFLIPQLLELPARHFFSPLPSAKAASYFMAVVLLLPFFALRRAPAMLLWGLWLLAVPLLIFTTDLLRRADQLQYLRYTITLAPVLCIVVAGFPWPRRWLAHAVPALLAAAALLALSTAYDHHKGQARTFGALMRATSPGEITVIVAPDDADVARYVYAAVDRYRATPPGPLLLLMDAPNEAAHERLVASPGIWFWCIGSRTPRDVLGPPFDHWRVLVYRFDVNTGALYHLLSP